MFRRAWEGDVGALEMVREARVISPGVLANSASEELQRQVWSSFRWWRGNPDLFQPE